MNGYLTKSSFLLPLTASQVAFAITAINCVQDDTIILTYSKRPKGNDIYDDDIMKIAYLLRDEMAEFDDKSEDYSMPFDYEVNDKGLRIFGNPHINIHIAAYFCHLILKHFDSDDYVAINSAFLCADDKLDEFAGYAIFITKDKLRSISTTFWINDMIFKHENNIIM